MARTTIALASQTRDALKRMGRKDETYDDLIRRLVRELLVARRRLRRLDKEVDEPQAPAARDPHDPDVA